MARNDSADLNEKTVEELREIAKDRGIGGTSHMKKAELVETLGGETQESRGSRGENDEGRRSGGGAESKSIRYSQHVDSPDEHEERPGRSLVTRDHDVIRQWAEARKATPATVPGTEHEGRAGVLRFDFPGYGGDNLEHIEWQAWFETFDARKLNFIYQEHRSDGRMSNFFRLENPDREDA